MPLDQLLRLVFRNFATLFFVAATVTVPLHVGHSFIHRETIEVRELHPFIREFPSETRTVRGVGQDEVQSADTSFLLVTALELLLVPLMAGAARRALTVDAGGSLATVTDAWTHSLAAWRRPAPARSDLGGVLMGCLAGAAVVYLAHSIGGLLAEPVSETVAFGVVGLAEGSAHALGAPFVLVPLALFRAHAKGRVAKKPTF